jgi:acyl carrier protein
MAVTKEGLLELFQTEMAIDTSDIEERTELFSSSIIDSFSLVTLITYIEREAQMRVDPLDVNLDNLDTIERILRYVESVS